MMNIPNMLSLLRLALLPVLFTFFYWQFPYHYAACTGVIILIGLSDFFDGYLARRWNQTSRFGAFIDPVADKIAVAMAYILVVEHYQSLWITLAAIIIIGREISISALREWMGTEGKGQIIAVSPIGKWKTTLQMWSVGGLFLVPDLDYFPFTVFIGLCLFAATGLTVISMIDYFAAAWKKLI
ncbi:MAG: CDP-diacylglycerol--glycerol-3-phosphate 3-phosphatidyltransferase [Gammaproteobacteria bacterium]